MNLSIFIYCFSIIAIVICENSHSNAMTLATWNIGLEEQLPFQRTASIIAKIRQKNVDILCLQEVWGGPQILRQIYQAVKDLYPYFEVVSDDMRHYISRNELPTHTYNPACVRSNILNAQICLFTHCSSINGTALLQCAINQCTIQFVALYTDVKCWACIFDRFITFNDPLGLNYCGAVNFPQSISTSSGIIPNSTEAPWDHSIGLMVLAKGRYHIKKLAAGLYPEFYILPRGYIIVGHEENKLIIANTHVATVEITLPHPPIGIFFNNKYGSWNDENKGQIIELESIVWKFLLNKNHNYKNAIMTGDFNMGISNFEHTVSAIQSDSWNYLHGLNDIHGLRRWYDDYTEMNSLCTRCQDNRLVQFTNQYIYDHIFTHGHLFNPSNVFTRRIFDEVIEIPATNGTAITTNLSDHYGVELISVY